MWCCVSSDGSARAIKVLLSSNHPTLPFSFRGCSLSRPRRLSRQKRNDFCSSNEWKPFLFCFVEFDRLDSLTVVFGRDLLAPVEKKKERKKQWWGRVKRRNLPRCVGVFPGDRFFCLRETPPYNQSKKEVLHENSSDLCSLFERQTNRAIHWGTITRL